MVAESNGLYRFQEYLWNLNMEEQQTAIIGGVEHAKLMDMLV